MGADHPPVVEAWVSPAPGANRAWASCVGGGAGVALRVGAWWRAGAGWGWNRGGGSRARHVGMGRSVAGGEGRRRGRAQPCEALERELEDDRGARENIKYWQPSRSARVTSLPDNLNLHMDMMNELARTIREKTTVQDAAPLAATAQLLCEASTQELTFDAAHLVLCPSVAPSEAIRRYLYQLAKDAQDAAYSRACSSILAGEGSEGDDTGDVAFWLGEGDFTSPGKVLEALGLSGNGVGVRTERHDCAD